jgi:hypothetical protein
MLVALTREVLASVVAYEHAHATREFRLSETAARPGQMPYRGKSSRRKRGEGEKRRRKAMHARVYAMKQASAVKKTIWLHIYHQHLVLCFGKIFQTAEEIESMQWVMLLTPSLLLLSLGAVPALFVFGDSLVDDGNSNSLASALVKANYFPYGLDVLAF